MEKIIFPLFLICVFGSPEALPPGPKMVIDHDGGADDAYAITMALQYEKYFNGPKVVALTTTYGNVNLTQATINSGRILKLVNRSDVPVYSGAVRSFIVTVQTDYFFGIDGLGDNDYNDTEPVILQKEHSAIALIDLSKKYKGELIVVALGPLTNIALAIRLDPEFICRLAHLYVAGGHFLDQNYTSPEFNAEMDVEAYYIVADSAQPDKVTFVPKLTVSKEWRINVFGSINSPLVQELTRYERISVPSYPTWTLLDPVVMAVVLDNRIATEFKKTNHSIITSGEKRGVNTNHFDALKPNSRIVYSAELQKYKDFLILVYTANISRSRRNY